MEEYGYIPTDKIIKSRSVSERAGRFYVSALINEELEKQEILLNDTGLGIDLGVKEFAVVSN